MTKADAARKLADLVSRLKLCNSVCHHTFKNEINALSKDIDLLEKELDLLIDDFQAARFEAYFVRKRRKEYESSVPFGQLLGMGNKNHHRRRDQDEFDS